MDKYKVKINHRAIRELNAIYDYIAKEKSSPEYAKRQTDRIKSACTTGFEAAAASGCANVMSSVFSIQSSHRLNIR